MDPIRHRAGAARLGHFGIDFAVFRLKKGTKTPENGPKYASSDYLSVNSPFWQIIHYL
jgi:hypothetical protein